MSEEKKLLAGIGCREGNAVLLSRRSGVSRRSLKSLAHYYNDNGADELLLWDLSESDEDHERTIGILKELARLIDIPVVTGGRVRRLEDVKKYLYAGAKAVFLDGSDMDNVDLIKEAADRFGSEKIYVYLPSPRLLGRVSEFLQLGASMILLDVGSNVEILESGAYTGQEGPFLILCNERELPVISVCMAADHCAGVILTVPEEEEGSYMELKGELKKRGQKVTTFDSTVEWADFKTNGDGLVPVIVQDYKTEQVLMLAYMNEQAFEDTLRTGKMNYYSRSRKSQWLKGETSGHFQYVKSLHLDCDNDTILARVHPVGPACHTGHTSCFFQTLAEKEHKETNPLKVFEDVFAVILDRKEHPREGSYTNYLFDKGTDKILKKVGEEATEIVIAAKNPDPEEIKYEISDFLYHVMVLMAVKGITWEEITQELANR
ncbi:MAG: bifunctional phosphoribosyl-AMP cyclohydrolase/phosphoribosyl-ATP diphosphatase HisIE [Lachnospiraceae bacterium]|nr:bifunctional phosphoribosyl-AMP cyclohydrolase/phosphoribosyl-ATP diphosphatase HisIE [Lachnospiraceae bacterium]